MNKNWKYEYHNKNNPIDFIWDLFDDTYKYLGKNKHIQDVKNFFKKFKITKYKDKNGYISQKSKDIFEQIAISEIKEIKFEKEVTINDKKTKQKKIITEQTEPTVQQVMDALIMHTNYAKAITDAIINSIMFIVIIIVGFFEAAQYLFKRLIEGIKYLYTLPYRQMFNVVLKISVVIIAIGFSIFIFNYFSSVSTAQKMSDIKIEKLEKEIKDIWVQIEWLKQENSWMKSNTQVIEHKIVSKEYVGRDGKIKYKEKIR